jgi:hypothetical protein
MQKFDTQDSLSASENYSNLLDYIFIPHSGKIEHRHEHVIFEINMPGLLKEDRHMDETVREVDKMIASQRQAFPNMKKFVPLLDFTGIEVLSGSGNSFIQTGIKNISTDSLIVLGIAASDLKKITDVTRNHKKLPDMLWAKEQFLLYYTHEDDSDGNRIFYSKIFGGKNWQECNLLMHKLISTHLTHEDYYPMEGPAKLDLAIIENISRSPLFINRSGIVQDFEVVIEIAGKSLFEHSMGFILNTDSEVVKNDFAGYQIKNSHFRLGSKVHIKDFLYAKRIFQNSFFTSRFAFLVARDFERSHGGITSLSIIGYGMYSQLLVNRIEEILSKRIASNDVDINHDMVSDAEDPHFIKGVSLKEHVLIVVPINTTFSTTFKIEHLIAERLKDRKSFEPLPSANLILVTHRDFRDVPYVKLLNEELSGNGPSSLISPYKTLNWLKIDALSKLVHIRANLPKKHERVQRYMIAIPSELYLPENCPLCFPGVVNDQTVERANMDEQILLQTDKTSVTPDLLLEIPQDFRLDVSLIDNSVYLNPAAMVSGHIAFKGNHFNHYIRTDHFFSEHKKKIEGWANERREQLFKAAPDMLSAGVLLLSAGNRNNTYFTDFINRSIFDDSAVIVHYDIAVQGTENFIKFFSAHVWQAKYIFYIDDVLQGGDTFLYMNDLVRHCNNLKSVKDGNFEDKCMDGILTLISKSTYYTRSTLIANLMDTFASVDPQLPGKLQYNAFYYLNISQVPSSHCPMCAMQAKYNELAQHSSLDSVRHYFYSKSLKLAVKDITAIVGQEDLSEVENWWKYDPLIDQYEVFPWKKAVSDDSLAGFIKFSDNGLPDKAYLKALIQHQLNHLLSNDTAIRNAFQKDISGMKKPAADDFVNGLFFKLLKSIKEKQPFEGFYDDVPHELWKLYDSILEELMIKVLSDFPFDNVKPVKEKLFYWMNLLIRVLMDKYEQRDFTFDSFRRVKFLLRRLAGMGANYTLYPDTIGRIKNMNDKYDRFAGRYRRWWNTINQELKNSQYKEKKPDAQLRKRYLEQALRNLEYMETTVRDFGYFFISILKEVTLNNDAKALQLEKTIDGIFEQGDYDHKMNFFYFLRLLKYENVSILKKGAELIYQHFLSNSLRNKLRLEHQKKIEFVWVQKKFDEKLTVAFEDYRLAHLRKYLKIEDYSQWADLNNPAYLKFLQFLYLYILLVNEEKNPLSADDLELKTASIIQNFFRLTGESSLKIKEDGLSGKTSIKYSKPKGAGAFLVLKFHDDKNSLINPDKLTVANATRPDKLRISLSSFDDESLCYIMINGISNKKHHLQYENLQRVGNLAPKNKKPWIIWELEKDEKGKHWYSLRGNVFSIAKEIQDQSTLLNTIQGDRFVIPDGFTESLYLPSDAQSLKFFRLSGISFDENSIYNDGKGVIGLFSSRSKTQQGDYLQELDKLKLSLILLPLITRYVNLHYDSAILNALVGEKIKKAEGAREKHGHGKMLDELKDLVSSTQAMESKQQAAEIIHKLLLSGGMIQERMRNYLEWQQLKDPTTKKHQIYGLLEIKKMTVGEIVKDLDRFINVILTNVIEGTRPVTADPIIRVRTGLDKKLKIPVPYNLYEIIISEGFINSKKYSPEQKEIDVRLFQKNGLVFIEISNNSKPVPELVLKRLNKVNKYNMHGLGLIDMICNKVFGQPAFKSCLPHEGYSTMLHKFILTFPIATV